MLKLNYFLADIFILSAEKQPIKLSWRKIEWLHEIMIWLYIILFLILIGGCIAWAVWKAPSDVDLWGEEQE